MSKRHFLRQLKLATGLTPVQYIRAVRLDKAREYIENETYPTVKEVAYSVGYKDIAYFSRQFKKAYGKLPSEY
jgi:AraC-like DNA-binding protein